MRIAWKLFFLSILKGELELTRSFPSFLLQAKLLENSAWLGAAPNNITGEFLALENMQSKKI